MDISALRVRIISLNEDLNYFDDLLRAKQGYEVNLWGLTEQLSLPNNLDNPEMLSLLEEKAKQLKKNIQNCDAMLEKTRLKMLKALGKS